MSALPNAYEDGMRLSAKGRHADAIGQFERALSQKPDDARVLFALGNTARALGLVRPAEEFFGRVLALEPQRIEALVNLANLLRTRGAYDAAETLLTPALARDGGAPEIWLTLGSVYRETGDASRAEEHYRQALLLKPGYVAALTNLADMRATAGDADEAFALYEQALAREPKNAQAKFNRSFLHFLKGNLRDGWRDYDARLKIPARHPLPDHGLARWDGGNLKRKRLLVSAEQGIGDQIMFASLIPGLLARAQEDGGSIVLECEPRLVALFARSFPAATVHASEVISQEGCIRARYDWLKAAGGANAYIEMGSLARVMRTSVSDFPAQNIYLQPDESETARWRAVFAERPATGICWRSGKSGGSRTLQYAPPACWTEFIRTLPGTIVCAQYDAVPDEIAALEAASGRAIFVPPALDQKNELDRTAAMLKALDGIASAPTAVSWLGAAAGTPVCKIQYDTGWTSFGESHEPFAPAATCAVPRSHGDWNDAFAQARERLTARL